MDTHTYTYMHIYVCIYDTTPTRHCRLTSLYNSLQLIAAAAATAVGSGTKGFGHIKLFRLLVLPTINR